MTFYIVSFLMVMGFGIIGSCLLTERDIPHKLAGLGFLLVAGVLATFAFNHTPGNTIKELDHTKCAQYEWVASQWTCVPWEEAG